MEASTALFVTLIAALFALIIVLFGALLSGDEPLYRAMFKSFALSAIGSVLLLRATIFSPTRGVPSPVLTAALVLTCVAVGTLVGGTLSALLMKAWRAWLRRSFPKP
jgi:hypothetical protein